ncbi:hypothetical protein BT96DRAFT_836799, partial [Gymnopus androsaceus JB14]
LRGHPHAVGLTIMEALHEVFHQNPDMYLNELQWFLATQHDFYIPISILQETLEHVGLTRRVMHKIAIERSEHL